ncbi:hypothetical protein F4779DRAFT_175886 [Xylariaceae sp. FL0662B]|nr:hypothetical protein F4779DRAFT_175886 [Xylariaceae sp. FL0662B]
MVGIKTRTGFQGHAYIILQIIRCCNIAVLLAVIVVSGIMMYFGKMPNGFQFFNDVTLAFIISVAGLLIWTEIPVKYGKAAIAQNWPAFGDDRGFTWLGIAMILMGCHHLGALSRDTFSKNVPFQVWQAIMGSGILAISFGVTNIIASLAFRNDKGRVRAREIRNRGATTQDVQFVPDYDSYRSNSVRKEKRSSFWRFGKGEKPQISHPIAHDLEHGPDGHPGDDRRSPVMPQVQRPPTALHPMNRTSLYSEASHIDRFTDNRI